MLRSLFSAVSGLKAHQTRMDVIGNNIANVNTYGYKSSRTTFRDMYYQTISSSTSASGTRSGSNASQVGYGASVGSVDILNTRTGYASTGSSMDLYIDGEGYFVVQDGAGNERLTQVGTFGFDGDGNLTDGNGNFICGYSVDKLKSTVSVGGAKVDFGLKADGTKNGGKVVDGKDVSYLEGYTFKVVDGGASATQAVAVDPTEKTITVTLKTADMTKQGLETALKSTTWTSTLMDGTDPAILKNSDGTYVKLSDVLDASLIKVADADTTAIKATTGKIAEEATFQGDGSGSEYLKKIINDKGEMKNLAVGSDGTITGEATDGTIQIIGKIAIANVPNPDALQHEGNSYYKAVNNTGVITYTTPGEDNTGSLKSGGLESSNVDLANEFSDMIMTQRGFQASSKMITVSDEMLETLVNLKR
ncbi:flagellar hook protein FlgE [Faecalispora anaeroviscerum]|uniref:flagellar hook protein FlgE n=1 Tax=Faecalispora anaeroviscerum TaxID=2991836 RepID=UPI0024B95E6F|nr:flagellar hook-basal body complex protein [Faecalispora anaeroviscerum]